MSFELRRDDGVTLSDDAARLDVDRIAGWLAESYWASDRDRATIERSLAGSLPYGVYAPDGGQIALTRATTDLTTFCWLGDVVVDQAWRGRGIGTWMIRGVVSQLRSRGVPRFVLATRDAHGVYERVGFEPLRVPSRWMEIDERTLRPNPGELGAE